MKAPIINNGTAHGSIVLAGTLAYATVPMIPSVMPSLPMYFTALTFGAITASYMFINGYREIKQDRAKETKLEIITA
jgi:4-hydroxybenzoate polyprenyltransferase